MNIKVNYANTASKSEFGEDFALIMNLLQELGNLSSTSGHGLAQFTLKTYRQREEIVEALKQLRLKGELRVNKMEEEDVDQQFF